MRFSVFGIPKTEEGQIFTGKDVSILQKVSPSKISDIGWKNEVISSTRALINA